jgi:hypothetical protein
LYKLLCQPSPAALPQVSLTTILAADFINIIAGSSNLASSKLNRPPFGSTPQEPSPQQSVRKKSAGIIMELVFS